MRSAAAFIAVPMAFAAACAAASTPNVSPPPSVYRYPAWFVDATAAGDATVGYAPRLASRAASESLAVVDGAWRAGLYRAVRVRDEQAFGNFSGGALDLLAESVAIDSDTDSISVHLIEFAEVGALAIALVGPSASLPMIATQQVAMAAVAPQWVTALGDSGEQVRALGIARATFREENGWREAEERGLRALAAQVMSRVRGLAFSTDNGQESVTMTYSDVELQDVRVLARWRDDLNCYVLMTGRGRPVGGT